MVTDRERSAAVEAVRLASAMCAAAQGRLTAGDTLTKGDDSPVTVADFASQAVVSAVLGERLGAFDLVGEEAAEDLRDEGNAPLLEGVVDLVRAVRSGDVADPRDVSPAAVLRWIDAGSSDGTSGRFWTLDPIDGTKGFVRGDQYAIALALVEQGRVVLGVLGCPNLPNPDGSVGAMFVADGDRCSVYEGRSTDARPARVASPATLARARVCESVEPGHSDHRHSATIAERLGIAVAPYRIDSQCKYGVVARGDASIYLRLPTRPDYREKIWDHAAGMFVVQCAGGRVSDVTGAELQFSHGRRLERNIGVVATDGRFHDEVLAAVAETLAAGPSGSTPV